MNTLKQELRQHLDAFAVRARAIMDFCDNEEQTKVSLINPFLEILGYDVRDPRHVRLEVRADFSAGSEKVDYAIFREDHPWMIVEAKKATLSLGDDTPTKQILRYAMATDVQYVAYTNGCHWRWFRKSANSPMLEKTPFLEHDVTEPGDREIRWLASIHHSICNADEIARIADEEMLQSLFETWYKSCRENPPAAFLKLLLNDHGFRASESMLKRAAAAWKATLKTADAATLRAASRRLRGDSMENQPPIAEKDPAMAGTGEDELAEYPGNDTAFRRQWRFRWRTRPGDAWKYGSGPRVRLAIAESLFSGVDADTCRRIAGQLNTQLIGDNLRRDTVRVLELGADIPRQFKGAGNPPRVAVYALMSLNESLLWLGRVRSAASNYEIQTEQGQRDSDTSEDQWPWMPIDSIR